MDLMLKVDVVAVVEWLLPGVVLIWRHSEELLDVVVEGLGTMEEEVALVVAEEVLVPVAEGVEDVEVKVRALHLLLPNLN
jgi:hypothetical protein